MAITGVSGSGKSSFVRGILLPALSGKLGDRVESEGFTPLAGGSWDSFEAGRIERVVAVEQRRPEPNRRSQVATFLDIADPLRRSYGRTPEARRLGLRPRDFGLNSGEGRCDTCLGLGEVEDGPGFAPCPACGGRRFADRVLTVRLGGLNMAQLLDASVGELAEEKPEWADELGDLFSLLVDLDLSYITLGRRVDRLSGGEVQRLRIARQLWRTRAAGTLFILDEPSAGLHPSDVDQLLRVLDRIVGGGENSVVLVEHNLRLIRACDWLIDFGPGGGPDGGRVVAEGTPAQVAKRATPTGRALRKAGAPGGSAARRSAQGSGRESRGSALDRPKQRPPRDAVAADRARRWLKLLLGHETALPPAGGAETPGEEAPDDLTGLAVVLDDVAVAGERPHELAGLDRELALLFLAADDIPPVAAQCRELLTAWYGQLDARLWIAPGLSLVRSWGSRVPASTRETVAQRLEQLDLNEQRESGDALAWRATGRRFAPQEDGGKPAIDEARRAALDDALLLGGGLAELRAPGGALLARVATRRLDLDRGLVAPLHLTTSHLLRSHPAGRCPACVGSGRREAVDLELIVRDRRQPATGEKLLTAEALAILKGVRRRVLQPFFRRLAEEGLWREDIAFAELDQAGRDLLVFGYWHRPGPGSFLKQHRSDPEKVSSWLRWDGLHHHLLEQLPRSRDRRWAEKVEASREEVACRLCAGSGLGAASRLVTLAGRSLQEWTLHATVAELSRAIESSRWDDARDRRVRDRVAAGLAPLRRLVPKQPLGQPLEEPAAVRAALEAVAGTMLTVPTVERSSP